MSLAREIAKGMREGAGRDVNPAHYTFVNIANIFGTLAEVGVTDNPCFPPFRSCWLEPGFAGIDAILADEIAVSELEAVVALRERMEKRIGYWPPKTVVQCSILAKRHGFYWNVGSGFYPLDAEGRCRTVRGTVPFISAFYQEPFGSRAAEMTQNHFEELSIAGSVPLALNALLSCKNVAVAPDPEDRRSIKRGRGQKRGITWHRLVVVAPGERIAGSPIVKAGSGTPMTRAHLARGHFKEYTADRPLFGRYSGRFWWSPHLRGDKGHGVVLKDYEVHAMSPIVP